MAEAAREETVVGAAATDPSGNHTRSGKRLYAVVFFLALGSVAWQVLLPSSAGFGSGWETVAVGRNLAAGKGFSNPFAALNTGPSAHLAPAFPTMLALLFRILGDNPSVGVVALALCALAHALYCLLLIPLSLLLFNDKKPGIWAAIFSAVVPTIEVLPQWEAIYAAVAGQLFCLASARLMRIRWSWIAGLLCGLMLLVNPALLFVGAAYLLYLRPRPKWIATFALAGFVVCLPWTARNYSKFGSLFFIRDNLGLELYTSNADCAEARDVANHVNGCHALLQPNLNRSEAEAVLKMGEVNYNRDRISIARRWISNHPGRFMRLTLVRIREFWFPTPGPVPVREYSQWLITALSFGGLIRLIRDRRPEAWFFCGALALYSLLYYFVQASPRFRTPVLWLSLLPAALMAQTIFEAARKAWRANQTS